MSVTGWLTGVALLLFLGGCAVPAAVRMEPPAPKPAVVIPPAREAPIVVKPVPEAPAVVKPAPPPEDPLSAFPGIFRAKALSEERQGDRRAALAYWRVVRAFLPEDPEATERVAALEERIRSEADGRLRKGRELYEKGEYGGARKEFLLALAYDPYLEEAADYLKRRLGWPNSRPYVTQEGDTLKFVAREIYNDPAKDVMIAYINDLDAGAPLRPGTRLTLPFLDFSVAGSSRSPSFAYTPAPAPERIPNGQAQTSDLLVKARTSFRDRDYEQAAALADQALAKSPASREAREMRNAAYYRMGTDYALKQAYQDALRMFRKVDASYKDQKEQVVRVESRVREEAETQYAVGLKRFLVEDLEGAVMAWEMTLKLNPAHTKAKQDLAKARRLLDKVRTIQ